jgi:hypothetical protein
VKEFVLLRPQRLEKSQNKNYSGKFWERMFDRDISNYEFNSLTFPSQEHETNQRARGQEGKTARRQLPFCRLASLPFNHCLGVFSEMNKTNFIVTLMMYYH